MLSKTQYRNCPNALAGWSNADNIGYMSELSKNLHAMLRAHGWTQRDLAQRSGVSQVTIHKIASGKSQRSKYLGDIAKALGCSVEELTGVVPINIPEFVDSSATASDEVQSYSLSRIDAWDSNTPLGEDEVELPLFREVELAAGSGCTEVQENHGAKLRFAKSTLRRKGIDQSHAACCFVNGDSMEPILPDGSTVGVDTADKQIVDGKMYAIDHGGLLRVKYLYRIPGGGIRIRSANRDHYPDEDLAPDQLESFRVIGRVFWYSVLL